MKQQYQVALVSVTTVALMGAVALPAFAQGQNSFGRYGAGGRQSSAATISSVSEQEKATLAYMLEEEKLAHDIYVALYEKWGINVFTNIANSESTHQSKLLNAAQRFSVSDSRTSTIGEFNNEDLQALYNSLLEKGLGSEVAAYEVGAAIETQDISDLKAAIASTDSAYLKTVYSQLLKGSENHLKAFNRKLGSAA